MKTKFNSQDGSVLVEFAILLPLLMIILFGIIDFGVLIYNQQVITNASREGARNGIACRYNAMTESNDYYDTSSIQNVVTNYCSRLITFGTKTPPTVIVTGCSTLPTIDNVLQVQVDFNHSFLVIPNFLPGIGNMQNIRAITTMAYE